MSRKAASVIAGIITALVLVLVLGVTGLANRSNQAAALAGTTTAGSGTKSTAGTAGVCVNPSDVAALQGQLSRYQTALQQANSQLQQAYNQIQLLQSQGRSSRGDDQNEHSGGFFNPFGGGG